MENNKGNNNNNNKMLKLENKNNTIHAQNEENQIQYKIFVQNSNSYKII